MPALDLAEGEQIRFGDIRLEVLHTPGHTEGSVCLLAQDERLLFTGDTLFRGGWGRVDLPGGSADAMIESLGRLATLEHDLRVLPGHGARTTIERERPGWRWWPASAGCRCSAARTTAHHSRPMTGSNAFRYPVWRRSTAKPGIPRRGARPRAGWSHRHRAMPRSCPAP